MTVLTEQQILNELDKKLKNAADRLRSSLDAAVYKHAVLGLIFLKYESDSFKMRQQEVLAQLKDRKGGQYYTPKSIGSIAGATKRRASALRALVPKGEENRAPMRKLMATL